jgi:hypothetical protein
MKTLVEMQDRPTEGSGRRRFLTTIVAVVGTTSLAGCSTLWDQTGAADVVVYNVRTEPIVVTVTITPTDAEEPHTARELEIAPGAKVDPVNRSKLPTNRSYSIGVEVNGGPSETFGWDDPDVELSPLYILVDETRNIEFLLQAG